MIQIISVGSAILWFHCDPVCAQLSKFLPEWAKISEMNLEIDKIDRTISHHLTHLNPLFLSISCACGASSFCAKLKIVSRSWNRRSKINLSMTFNLLSTEITCMHLPISDRQLDRKWFHRSDNVIATDHFQWNYAKPSIFSTHFYWKFCTPLCVDLIWFFHFSMSKYWKTNIFRIAVRLTVRDNSTIVVLNEVNKPNASDVLSHSVFAPKIRQLSTVGTTWNRSHRATHHCTQQPLASTLCVRSWLHANDQMRIFSLFAFIRPSLKSINRVPTAPFTNSSKEQIVSNSTLSKLKTYRFHFFAGIAFLTPNTSFAHPRRYNKYIIGYINEPNGHVFFFDTFIKYLYITILVQFPSEVIMCVFI